MIKILKEIFQILSYKQKVSLFYLQLSIIFSSLVELFSIFIILLFVKIGYNFDFVLKNNVVIIFPTFFYYMLTYIFVFFIALPIKK